MAESRPAPPDDEEDDAILLPATPDLTAEAAQALLRDGELALIGRLIASSNNALLGTVSRAMAAGTPDEPADDRVAAGDGIGDRGAGVPAGPPLVAPCVYKPIRGERPLWDFPDGTLAAREVAAYLVSEATPWAVVPPTVLRDGPFGSGMVQLWIHPDELADAVAMVIEGDRRLRPMALFDVVVNNADRKAGHLLPLPDGHVYGVDHGICFNEEPKLRTVLWHWRGERLTHEEVGVLRALHSELAGSLGDALAPLLTEAETAAIGERIRALIADGCFPHPDPDRPAIPWPPY
jgi:hypothetical protein